MGPNVGLEDRLSRVEQENRRLRMGGVVLLIALCGQEVRHDHLAGDAARGVDDL